MHQSNQRSAVGIPLESPYLTILLNQLGLQARVIARPTADELAEARVIFWNDAATLRSDELRSKSVAVITDHQTLARIVPNLKSDTTIAFSFQSGSPFAPRTFFAQQRIATINADSVGHCLDQAGVKISGSGIVVMELGQALLLSLPWNIAAFRPGEDWGYRAYYSAATRKHFASIGPYIDTGPLRRLLSEMLHIAFKHVGEAPRRRPRMTAQQLIFRLDADGYSKEGLDAGLELSAECGARFSWFIDVGGWVGYWPELRRLTDARQDVQLHCFTHSTFRSRAANRGNLAAGLRGLASQGIIARGFVAPCGFYTSGLGRAVQDLGFEFSSEFAFATDDLPMQPPWADRQVLQLPAHPGSICDFVDAGFLPDDIEQHLLHVARRQVERDGTAIIYDHPRDLRGPHRAMYGRVLKSLLSHGCHPATMSEYAAAWRANAQRAETELWEAAGIEKQPDAFRPPPIEISRLCERLTRERMAAMDQSWLGWYLRHLYHHVLRRKA